MNPIYRPRVSTPDQVRDLVRNALYERELRRSAETRGVPQSADVVTAMSERAEYTNVQHFVAREVYAGLPMDSLTLRRHYLAKLAEWDLPERASVVRVTLEDRAAAEAMLRRFTIPGEAESLATRASRGGVSYDAIVTAEQDSALFAIARRKGAGGVAGPDSVADGWRVVKVLTLQPRRHRTMEEALPYVQKDWYGIEGERRMRALLDGLRRHSRIVLNERWLARPARAAVSFTR